MKVLPYFLLILQLMSCSTKPYMGVEPDFKVKTPKKRAQEAQKFAFQEYKIPMPYYRTIKMGKGKYHHQDLEHIMEGVRPGSYSAWKKPTWGSYLAIAALLPAIYFVRKSVREDFSLSNIGLFGISAFAVGYGSIMEQKYRNQLIHDHNRELRFKLNLIRKHF